MTDQIYSNAFNFSSYQDGRVDMRTGQYSAVVTLVALRPEGGGGDAESRNLTLTFSMAKTTNDGYGIGWTLNVTSFDIANLVLSLSTGERYKANPLPAVGQLLTFQDRKLKNVEVRRTATATLEVMYGDGVTETLTRPTGTGPYRTTRITWETGESQRLDYSTGGWLTRVTGEQTGTVFLEASYVSGTISRVTTIATGGRRSAVTFTASNGLLTEISMPFDAAAAPEQVRRYRYQTFANGMRGISRVETPMGGLELVTYLERGLPYYNNTYLPAVTVWERQPAGGRQEAGLPATVTRYRYSTTTNFTGYPFAGGFVAGTDNLYRVPGVYSYWCEASTVNPDAGNAVLSKVTTTYNKFHLMTQERQEQDGVTKTTDITYNELPNTNFADQPANLQLAKSTVTTFGANGASRTETTLMSTDDYGNLLSKTEPSGLRLDYDYYPIAGTPGRCPPEPNGLFVRFRAAERAVPAGGGTAREVSTTYQQIARLGGGSYVQPLTDTVSGGATITYTIIGDSARPLVHGRPQRQVMVLDGQTTTTDFSYTVSGVELDETRTITGHDGTKAVSGRRTLPASDAMIEARASTGSVIRYTYDAAARVTSETVAPDTAAAAVRRYSYRFAAWSGGVLSTPAELQTVDALGRTYATRYDGLGRAIASVELLSGTERPISATTWDRLGRKATETSYDQPPGGAQLSLVSRYGYNGWNDLVTTTNPDGSVTLSVRDRVANTMTTGTQGLNTTVTSFNGFDKPATVVQVDTAGNRLQTLTRGYDGFGRCTSLTDVDGNVTRYSYDAFDRMTGSSTTPADGTPARSVALGYAPGSSAELHATVTVNGTRLGTRSHDGVGRMITESLGDGTTRLAYDGADPQPASRTTPAGIIRQFTYDPAQKSLTRITLADGSHSDYAYAAASGRLTRSTNTTARRDRSYDGYEFPTSQTVNTDGTDTTTRFTWSPGGRLTRMEAPVGDAETRSYDSAGRLVSITSGGCTITHSYDSHGRPVTTTIAEGGRSLVTTVAFDGYGREASRDFTLNGALQRRVSRSYLKNGNLSRRLTTAGNGATIADEQFTYDAYGRLTGYACTGSDHPRDPQGRAIAGQSFTFDALDNITSCTTSFTDGSSNRADRIFATTNPTKLVEIRTTNPAGTRRLSYDADGNMIDDGAGRQFTWDGFGRLVACSGAGGYAYDAENRLVTQTAPGAAPLHLDYGEEGLIAERQGGNTLRYRRDGTATRGQALTEGGVTRLRENLLDTTGSVIASVGDGGATAGIVYTPYGGAGPAGVTSATPLIDRNRVAFNGERLDALAGLYHLGQGRRAYCPELMVFLSPDPYAVFGGAGYNAYGYCRGDPVNLSDPSGLLSNGWNLGLAIVGFVLAAVLVVAAIPTGGASIGALAVLGMVGAGLGFVSATLGLTSAIMGVVDDANGWDRSETIRNLNIASLAFGVASVVTSAASAIGSTYKAYQGMRSVRLYGLSEVSSVDIALADLTGTAAFSAANTTERVANAAASGTRTFFGIESRWWASITGVANMALGSYFIAAGSIDLANPSGQTGTGGGANGNGQPEATLGGSTPESTAAAQPYAPSLRRFEDPVTSRRSFDEEFTRQNNRLRSSLSSQLAGGAA